MKETSQNIWINRVGMAAIIIVSLGYVLFGSTFAQLRIEPSFLDFPIFIGEILLFVSSIFFIIKSLRQGWELGRWGSILGAYLFFVLLKAFSGYFVWGPLAFRDAALFYYPFFIVLGYSFWSCDFEGDRTRRLLIIVILSIFILHQYIAFWPCTLIIMAVILSLKAKIVQEQWILIGAILLLAPYESLFNIYYRTAFLSSLITMVFIGVIFFILYCKNRWVRIMGIVLGGLVVGIVLFKVGQTGLLNTFIVKDTKPLVTTLPQNPSRGKYLFHPVGSLPEKPDTIKEFSQRISNRIFFLGKLKHNEIYVSKKSEICVIKKVETLENKKSDTAFRYYIWRDMAMEYVRYKPFFGFDFGRPLLPSTMLYYRMPSTANTDGWIGAHNSFFYIIYRAGIIGLFMVFSLLFIWFDLLHDFYILKDWMGILLCAILLNWIVSANFFLIFELPYTAIPVWTILGITLKHRMLLKK